MGISDHSRASASFDAVTPRAIIAEDELLLRQGLERLLRDGGIDVVASASDAADLVRKTKAHRPDVVDTYTWRVFEPEELARYAGSFGLSLVAACSEFDATSRPTPDRPRMQLVFAKGA